MKFSLTQISSTQKLWSTYWQIHEQVNFCTVWIFGLTFLTPHVFECSWWHTYNEDYSFIYTLPKCKWQQSNDILNSFPVNVYPSSLKFLFNKQILTVSMGKHIHWCKTVPNVPVVPNVPGSFQPHLLHYDVLQDAAESHDTGTIKLKSEL